MKGIFSKITVIFCICFCAFMSVWAMRIISHTGINASSILTPVFALFGGELLLLCLKRIFAKTDEKDKENRFTKEIGDDT